MDSAIFVTVDMQNLGKSLIPYGLCVLGDRSFDILIGEKPRIVKGEMFARGMWVSKRIFYIPDEVLLYKLQRHLQNSVDKSE